MPQGTGYGASGPFTSPSSERRTASARAKGVPGTDQSSVYVRAVMCRLALKWGHDADCSEKGNHAGYARPDSERMKFYWDKLPEELKKVIR